MMAQLWVRNGSDLMLLFKSNLHQRLETTHIHTEFGVESGVPYENANTTGVPPLKHALTSSKHWHYLLVNGDILSRTHTQINAQARKDTQGMGPKKVRLEGVEQGVFLADFWPANRGQRLNHSTAILKHNMTASGGIIRAKNEHRRRVLG